MTEQNPNPSLEERMLERRYYVFAPKGPKDLRQYYPELMEYPECKPQAIKEADLLFAWWYSCKCSPLYDMEGQEKMDECVQLAYKSAQQRMAKLADFRSKLPDNIRAAMKRMESFNVGSRVSNYVQTMTVRENCNAMLAADMSLMNEDEKDAWATRAPKLWKLLEETGRTIERGAFGVSAYEETTLDEADGTLRHFRNNRK